MAFFGYFLSPRKESIPPEAVKKGKKRNSPAVGRKKEKKRNFPVGDKKKKTSKFSPEKKRDFPTFLV